MDLFKLLQTLTQTAGPSGFEIEVATVVQEVWQPYVDEITIDRMGNLVAVKEGRLDPAGQPNERRPRLLLAAHMDELGLMVKQIVAHPKEGGNGFLRLTNLGGVDTRQLYGQLVTVHGSVNGRHTLPGIIGALPPKMLPQERHNKPYRYEDLVVDVGLPAEELRQQVAVGDVISFDQPLRKLLGKRVAGKSLDNRASIAAVTVCLDYLSRRYHDWDVMAVATVQEETRLLGALTSGYTLMPDVAVALDVTFGKGPGVSDAVAYELGDGPTLGLGPNVHPGVFQALQEAAKALEMDVHTEPHARASGTDAFGLQIAREGIPTGLVSIPLRYMHTMVESIALTDVERAGRLVGEFIARLDAGFIDQLTKALDGNEEANE